MTFHLRLGRREALRSSETRTSTLAMGLVRGPKAARNLRLRPVDGSRAAFYAGRMSAHRQSVRREARVSFLDLAPAHDGVKPGLLVDPPTNHV